MTQWEALQLFKDVRADYVAMLRDLHGLRKVKRPFDPTDSTIVERLDRAIKSLQLAFPEHKPKIDPYPQGTLAEAMRPYENKPPI